MGIPLTEANDLIGVSAPSGPRRLSSSLILAALLLGIVAIGLTTRLYHFTKFSLWLDDFFTLEAATGRDQLHDYLPLNRLIDPSPEFTSFETGPGFFGIWTNLHTVVHPPLYFMALNIWSHLFGSSDTAARSLSTVCSLIGMGLLFDFVRLNYGVKLGLWSAAIAAVASPQVVFSQQVRSYTMTMTLILWCADIVTRIDLLGLTFRRWVWLLVALLVMMLTHYLAAGAGAALFIFVLLRFRGAELRKMVGCFLLAGAIYAIIWGPFFLEQSKEFSRELDFLSDTQNGIVLRTFRRLSEVPLRMISEPMRNSVQASRLGAVIFGLPFLLLRQNPRLLLMGLLVLCPALEVAVRDLLSHGCATETLRYIYFSSVPLYAVLACLLAYRDNWVRYLLPVVTFAGCVMTLDRAYALGQSDLRAPSRALRDHLRPGGIVLFSKYNSADWRSAAYCLEICHYSKLTAPLALIDQPPQGELLEQLKQAPQVLFCSKDELRFLTNVLPPDAIHAYRDFPMAGAIYDVDVAKLLGATSRPAH